MELRTNPRRQAQGVLGSLHWYTQLRVMVGMSVVLMALLAMFAPPGLGLAIFSTIALLAGGALAAYAWTRGLRQHDRVSIWDVSGSLLFVGFFAAILSRPDQVLQLIAS